MAFNSRMGGPASLKITPNAYCKLFHGKKCEGTAWLSTFSLYRTDEVEDIGVWGNSYMSIKCKAEAWE